jgi:hypothetical protein
MNSRFFVCMLALVALILVPFATQAADPEREALVAAKAWLTLVDQGDYAKSWDTAAELFKGAITKDKWAQTIKGVRPPLGKVLSRKVKSKTYATELPGAPDGEYVVIQFETSFENKKSAVETVTPMKDRDGKWRVSGYFIK